MQKYSEIEIAEKLKELPDWNYEDGAIYREAKFDSFKTTFSIMTRIAFECEKQDHHPNWTNVYNSLSIHLNTHDAGGITEKDFALAKTINTILNA